MTDNEWQVLPEPPREKIGYELPFAYSRKTIHKAQP